MTPLEWEQLGDDLHEADDGQHVSAVIERVPGGFVGWYCFEVTVKAGDLELITSAIDLDQAKREVEALQYAIDEYISRYHELLERDRRKAARP
jgi:hypothetical protein